VSATSAEEQFEQLVDAFTRIDGVTPPTPGRGFGSSALRYRGKIFAMCVRGELIVKLPAARVTTLVANGGGAHFDANKGTPMKEWFRLDAASTLDWPALAHEALAFAQK
jgi:TfoX/Sxy family transcriptional regulator of competence genes